jgi:hypothetical protein
LGDLFETEDLCGDLVGDDWRDLLVEYLLVDFTVELLLGLFLNGDFLLFLGDFSVFIGLIQALNSSKLSFPSASISILLIIESRSCIVIEYPFLLRKSLISYALMKLRWSTSTTLKQSTAEKSCLEAKLFFNVSNWLW